VKDKGIAEGTEKRDPAQEDPQLLKKRKIISLVSLCLVIALIILLTHLIGRPLVDALKNRTSFRAWMQERGFMKYPLMAGIMALQVIIAFIPGEPIEIAAGFIFGAWGGLALCLIGAALGSIIIILAVRARGIKLIRLFFSDRQIANIKFLKDPSKRDATIFLLFLIPGTPKDVLTYLTGLVPIRLWRYLLITSLARIPSVLSSTLGGSMLDQQEYKLALLVFGLTIAFTLTAALIYRARQKRAAKALPYEEKAPENQDGHIVKEDQKDVQA